MAAKDEMTTLSSALDKWIRRDSLRLADAASNGRFTTGDIPCGKASRIEPKKTVRAEREM
jgi:hypothetical protein